MEVKQCIEDIKLFMQTNIIERSLGRCLNLLEESISNATNVNELLAVFDLAKSFNRQLNYNNTILFIIIIVCFAGGIFLRATTEFSESCFFMWGIGISVIGIVFFRANKVNKIVELLFFKKVLFDNNLAELKFNKKDAAQAFGQQFVDFQRGNYSREIHKLVEGMYKNKFSYKYFHFHFVDSYTTTKTNSRGYTETETKYHNYDRYGIIIKFVGFDAIGIYNYKPKMKGIKWKTSSICFNKIFTTYSRNEKNIATFLSPKVIEQFEEIAKVFSDLNVEISEDGFLSLSVSDEHLLNFSSKCGLGNLDKLRRAVEIPINQEKLNIALDFLNFLRDHHSSSF